MPTKTPKKRAHTRKQTSDRVSKLSAKGWRNLSLFLATYPRMRKVRLAFDGLTHEERWSIYASNVGQDEVKGSRPSRKRTQGKR